MNIVEMVRKHDPENQFKVLVESYKQIEYAWNNNIDLSSIDVKKIKNVIVTGLGGSAIGGELFQNYTRAEFKLPYNVNRNYELPLYANEETLVIASSYSGNTEETVSALKNSINRNCQIVCITTGGKLEKIAKENNLPLAILQQGFQPRYALWINFFTLLKIFHNIKLVTDHNDIVEKSIDLLKTCGQEYSKQRNKALEIAESLIGFIPLVYGVSDYTSAAATRLKGQFNENSKLHSFFNNYPELDHNEIIGWESFNQEKVHLKLINLMDDIYNPQIKKRFDITTEIIKKTGCEIIELKSNQTNFKLRILDIIYLGDWITYYVAILRSYSPTAIDNINYLKEHL